MNEKIEMYYPYNETFENYAPGKAGMKRAQEFIDTQNKCKGGHWIIHTKEQFNEWWEKKGKYLDYLEQIGLKNV